MSSGTIVGLALIFAGIMDVVLAFAVIGPRIADEGRRKVLQLALGLGAAVMLGLGAAFLSGMLGLGAGTID